MGASGICLQTLSHENMNFTCDTFAFLNDLSGLSSVMPWVQQLCYEISLF